MNNICTCRYDVICIVVLQANLERLENEMKEVNANYEALKRNFSDLTELKHILSKTNHFFEEVRTAAIFFSEDIFHYAFTVLLSVTLMLNTILKLAS